MAFRKKLPAWDNITRLVLVKFLTTLYFYLPYMTLYFRGRGLSYTQINSVWGIVVFTIFLMEIPTGILADRWGRRRAVQAAIFFQFIGELLFLFIQDYWLLAVDAVIAGIGFAFGSGALEALVYDALIRENRPEEMQKVMGRLNGAGYLGFILSFAVSGFLIQNATETQIRTAVLATMIAVGLGFLVTLTLRPAEMEPAAPHQAASPLIYIKDGIRLLRENKPLRRLVLLSLLTIAFWDYFSGLHQPYFQQIGVPDWLFGPSMALASLLAFIASRNAHRIEKRLGPRWSLRIATLGPGLIYLLVFINRLPIIGILSLALFRGFDALKHPLFSDYNNRHIPSHNRATVLSMISMISGGYTAVMGLVIGRIADRWLLGAFLFCGVLVSIAALGIKLDETSLSPPQNKDSCSTSARGG
jgi:MFS family permease